MDKLWNTNHKSQMKKNREFLFAKKELRMKWTDDSPVITNDQFENYCAIEEALLQAPILIFEMIEMAQKLEAAGISIVWIFPGHANLVRFMKQRYSHYQEVPEIVRSVRRFKSLFDGKYSVIEKLGSTKLQFYCPVNNMDGMHRPHNVRIRDGPLNPEDQLDLNKFEAYFDNAPIDTFDGIVMVMTNNRLFPIREYKIPMITGTYGWSLIGQTANPLVSDTEVARLNPNFSFMNQYVRAGQRVDLVNVASDKNRAKIIKTILQNQTSRDNHGYVMIDPDPRFPQANHAVPFPAIAGTRPHITDDPSYRTTLLR